MRSHHPQRCEAAWDLCKELVLAGGWSYTQIAVVMTRRLGRNFDKNAVAGMTFKMRTSGELPPANVTMSMRRALSRKERAPISLAPLPSRRS